jgi:hypothetical protein
MGEVFIKALPDELYKLFAAADALPALFIGTEGGDVTWQGEAEVLQLRS